MALSTRSEWGWFYRENRPFFRFYAVGLICAAASSGGSLVQPLIMKWLIDDILPHRRWGAVVVAAGLFFAASLGRAAVASLGAFINMLGVKRMRFHLQLRLVKHVQSLSADFHARHAVGDLVQRLEGDVNVLATFASDALPTLSRMTVGTLMAVAVMFYLDWRLSSVVVPLLPIFVYHRHRYRGILRRRADAVREATDRQSSVLQEMLTGAIQIQLLGAEHRLAREYMRASLHTMKREIEQRRSEVFYSLISISIIGLAVALIIAYGGLRVLSGALTMGGLVAFYGYIGSVFAPMNEAILMFAQIVRVQSSIHRLRAIEDTPEIVRDAPDAVPLDSVPAVLTYRNVAFHYAPDKLSSAPSTSTPARENGSPSWGRVAAARARCSSSWRVCTM
jgi:ABC-type bacteriocin/lantibiotic exporter with double-glycine peptidase domain